MGKLKSGVELPGHKIIDLSIALVSLLSFIFNFAFPHLVFASNVDRNKAIAFDLLSKVTPYSFAADANAQSVQKDKEAKLLPVETGKVAYKASAVIASESVEKKAASSQKLARTPDAEGFDFAEYAAKDRFVNSEKDAIIAAGGGKVVLKKKVLITAYSSTPDQTDSSPFITASNTHVRDGIVATNFLPFGTRIRIPAIYPEKIFIVEDRMKSNVKVDIWFPTRQAALQFGAKWAEIEVLEVQ